MSRIYIMKHFVAPLTRISTTIDKLWRISSKMMDNL